LSPQQAVATTQWETAPAIVMSPEAAAECTPTACLYPCRTEVLPMHKPLQYFNYNVTITPVSRYTSNANPLAGIHGSRIVTWEMLYGRD
jgi:hypothetical protein